MIGKRRSLLRLQVNGFLFALAAKLAGKFPLAAQSYTFHAALEIFHGEGHNDLLAGLHLKSLTVLFDFSPLSRLLTVRFPHQNRRRGIGGVNRYPRNRLQTTSCRSVHLLFLPLG